MSFVAVRKTPSDSLLNLWVFLGYEEREEDEQSGERGKTGKEPRFGRKRTVKEREEGTYGSLCHPHSKDS